MSRTTTGGTRLRILSAVFATAAIAAGVYAAYGTAHHRTFYLCTLDRASVKGGDSIVAVCSGLNSGHTYDFVRNTASPLQNTSNVSGAALVGSGGSLSTAASGSTTAGAFYTVYDHTTDPTHTSALGQTAPIDAYNVSWDNADGNIGPNDTSTYVEADGLLSSDSLVMRPLDTSGSPDATGFATASPLNEQFSSTPPYNLSVSSDGSGVMAVTLDAVTIMSSVNFKYGIYKNGEIIAISPTYTHQSQ